MASRPFVAGRELSIGAMPEKTEPGGFIVRLRRRFRAAPGRLWLDGGLSR